MRFPTRTSLSAGLAAAALLAPSTRAQVGACPDWALPPANVSNDPAVSINPAVSVSDTGILSVAWFDGAGPGIRYRRSTDGGLTWDPALLLPNSAATSARPSMSSRGMTIDVVFVGSPSGGMGPTAKLARSTNGGMSFSTQTIPSPPGTAPILVKVRTTEDSSYVLFNNLVLGTPNKDVSISKSTDGGMTWANLPFPSGSTLSCDAPAFDVLPDFLDSGGDQISLAYRQFLPSTTPTASVIFRQSDDGGQTWSAPLVLDASVPATGSGPVPDYPLDVSSKGDRVAVLYLDEAPPGQTAPDIAYRESQDGGISFGAPINLTAGIDVLPGYSTVRAVGGRSYVYTQMTTPGINLAQVYEICVDGASATRATPITPPNSNGASVSSNGSAMLLGYNQVVGGSNLEISATVAPLCGQLKRVDGFACPGMAGPASATATGDFCGTFNVVFTNLPPATIGLLAIAAQLALTPPVILGCPVGVEPFGVVFAPVTADSTGSVVLTAGGPLGSGFAFLLAYLDPTSVGGLGLSLSELYCFLYGGQL